MQTLPNGWPADTSVETIPEFQIATTSPAVPDGVAPVSTYQVRRDLTGGGLPGAARGGSGFSVADATVTVPQQGTPVTPWARTPVMPGGAATLQAAHGDATLPLGAFLVDDITGADSDGEVTLSLIEKQASLDREYTYVRGYDGNVDGSGSTTFDAAAVINAAARNAGYTTHRTPTIPGWELMIAAPLDGDPLPSPGLPLSISTARFGAQGHRIGLTGGLVWAAFGSETETLSSYWRVAVHAEAQGTGGSVQVGLWTVTINPTTGTITAQMGSAGSGTYPIPTTPQGGVYTVILNRDSSTKLSVYLSTPASPSATKLGTITTTDTIPYWDGSNAVRITPNGASPWIGGVAVWATSTGAITPTPVYPGPVNALIEPASSPLVGAFNAGGQSCREVMQDVARATMGAAWVTEDGTLVYRNAASMRTGSAVETIVSDRQLEDLPWQISREDSADRVEYTYTPANLERDPTSALTIWEATEKTSVPAGKTVTITATLDNVAADQIATFLPIWDTTTAGSDGTRMSRWAAATSPNGGGTRPADAAIKVNVTLAGATASLRVTNTTSSTLWLVDGNGEPCLILRAAVKVGPGEQQTLEWGASKEAAVNPFTFDAGQWVQDAETAQEQLNWLASQMQQAQATIPQVNVKPNLTRQLGDIVVLTENQLTPDHKPLKSKALITGSDLDGDANGYTTTLNLALLGVTFYDLDEWATRNSVTTFGNLDTRLTNLGISTFGDLDAWLAAGNTI